jgi:hypothetical protein
MHWHTTCCAVNRIVLNILLVRIEPPYRFDPDLEAEVLLPRKMDMGCAGRFKATLKRAIYDAVEPEFGQAFPPLQARSKPAAVWGSKHYMLKFDD